MQGRMPPTNGPERRGGHGRRSEDVIDLRLENIERWVADERTARRQHFSELLKSVRELREDFNTHRTETMKALGEVVDDQREGRRALIGSMIAAAGAIIVALVGAAALIVTQT